MRLRNVQNAIEILEKSPYYIKTPINMIGKWDKVFQNALLKETEENWFATYFNAPIHLEIGCGKGKFLIEMAKKHPNICFVGMEYQKSVLVRAIQKVEQENLPNIRFICWNASLVKEVFDHEISVLYLNFSDPWPKKRHAKRRLTHPDFINGYETIFKDTKTIIQKTDNLNLFIYSLESLSKCGYTLEKISLDLEQENIENIKTEYEEKFTNLGCKINYVKAVKQK